MVESIVAPPAWYSDPNSHVPEALFPPSVPAVSVALLVTVIVSPALFGRSVPVVRFRLFPIIVVPFQSTVLPLFMLRFAIVPDVGDRSASVALVVLICTTPLLLVKVPAKSIAKLLSSDMMYMFPFVASIVPPGV